MSQVHRWSAVSLQQMDISKDMGSPYGQLIQDLYISQTLKTLETMETF